MSSVDVIKNYLSEYIKQIGNFLFSTWQGRIILVGVGAYLLKDKISALFQSKLGKAGGGGSIKAGGLNVNVTSSINPSNRNETYLRITIDPQDSTAKKVASSAEFILLADESGSMGGSDMYSKDGQRISRTASVVEGVRELVDFSRQNPSCKFKVSLFTFDDQCRKQFENQPAETLNPNVITFKGGGTTINNALAGITNHIKTLPDSPTPRVLIVLTDGEDSGFTNNSGFTLNNSPRAEFQRLCKEKNVKVVAVGMSQVHDKNVLKKIITEMDARGNDTTTTLPGSLYYYIDGQLVQAGSTEYDLGKRTFPQIIEEVCQGISSLSHEEMSISLDADSSIAGSDKIKKAGKLYQIGELANNQVEIILKVKTDHSKPCEISFKAKPLDRSQTDIDVKIDHSMNKNVNYEVLTRVIEDELKRTFADVSDAYNYQQRDTYDPCRQMIQTALDHAATLPKKSQTILSLEQQLNGVLGAINRGQPIDDATGRAALGVRTRLSYSTAKSASAMSSSATVKRLVSANAYSAAGGHVPANLGVIQKTIQEIYQGIKVSDTKINQGQYIANPAQAATMHNLGFPLGYDMLGLAEGTILSIPPDDVNEDGSINAEFVGDSEIAAFCKRYKMHFRLVLQPECQINLPLATKKALLIPDDATHFQWIDPAALEPVFDADCDPDLKWEKDDDYDDKAQKRKLLEELMAKELSPIACNLLNIGGFIYHSGHHFIGSESLPPPAVENRNFSYVNGVWIDSRTHQRVYENSSDADRMRRVTSQIRVVNSPFKALPNQVLPLGKPTPVPEEVHNQLKEWVDHIEECPYMSEVTIPALRDKGLEYFKWLNPGHPLIAKTKEHLRRTCTNAAEARLYNGSWGDYGVYIYYSPDKTKSCISPVVSLPEAVKNLRGKYFNCEIDPTSNVVQENLISDNCVVCQDKPPVYKFDGCDHGGKAVVCEDCFPHIVQGQPDPYRENVFINEKQCPLDRTKFENGIKAQASGVNVADEIEKKHKTIPFSLGKINIDYKVSDWLTRGFLQNPTFLSKKYPINDKVRAKFNLPKECTEWAFVYPVYGKQLSDAFSEVIMAHEVISRLNGKAGCENEANLMEGLFSIGGFAFFDRNGKVQDSYAFLGPNKPVAGSITLNAEFSRDQGKKSALDTAYQQLLDTQKQEEIRPEDQPDIGRITLGLFYSFAEFFQFAGNSFSYRSHDSTNNTFFSYRLTELM